MRLKEINRMMTRRMMARKMMTRKRMSKRIMIRKMRETTLPNKIIKTMKSKMMKRNDSYFYKNKGYICNPAFEIVKYFKIK